MKTHNPSTLTSQSSFTPFRAVTAKEISPMISKEHTVHWEHRNIVFCLASCLHIISQFHLRLYFSFFFPIVPVTTSLGQNTVLICKLFHCDSMRASLIYKTTRWATEVMIGGSVPINAIRLNFIDRIFECCSNGCWRRKQEWS